jgi:hypothetical protein
MKSLLPLLSTVSARLLYYLIVARMRLSLKLKRMFISASP